MQKKRTLDEARQGFSAGRKIEFHSLRNMVEDSLN
jgi:hypothetical protein